jgi:hypothetical protein
MTKTLLAALLFAAGAAQAAPCDLSDAVALRVARGAEIVIPPGGSGTSTNPGGTFAWVTASLGNTPVLQYLWAASATGTVTVAGSVDGVTFCPAADPVNFALTSTSTSYTTAVLIPASSTYLRLALDATGQPMTVTLQRPQ